MGRAVRYVADFFPSTVGEVTLTAADRTDMPTAAIIEVVKSTGGLQNGAAYSRCVTDFTRTGILNGFDLHGTTVMQSGREHVTGIEQFGTTPGVRLLDAVDGTTPFTPIALAEFEPVAGGIRLDTTGGSYAIQVTLLFEWNAYVVNDDGDGSWSTDEAIALNHGLGAPAGLGFVFSNSLFDSANNHMNMSVGLFIDDGAFDDDNNWVPDISQYCAGYRWQNAVSTTNTAGRLYSNRVAALCNNSGGSFSSQEVTYNDTNLLQITNRDGGAAGAGVVALLLDTQGIDVALEVIDLPSSGASDWEYNGTVFEPGALFGIMTQFTALDTGAGSSLAGGYSMVGWADDGSSMSLGMTSVDNVTTSDTSSHSSDTSLQNYSDDGTLTHQVDDLTFTADGFDVLAADLTATGSAKFIAAFLSGSAPEVVNAIDQMGEIPGLAVIFNNEINVRISGSTFSASGVVQLSDYDIQAGESPGTAVTQTQISYSDTEIRFDVSLGALSAGSLYLTVTPTSGDPSTIPVTVNADPGASAVGRRAVTVPLSVVQGTPIAPQNLALYFFKTDAQDTVVYSVNTLPAGLSLVGSTISGTIATSAAAFSPISITATVTDSFGNDADDTFTWTIAAPSGDLTQKIKTVQFQSIGPDLWDTDTDETAMVLRFIGLQKTDGKRFLEEQIYQPLGLYSPVLADGSLGLRRMNPILADAPYVLLLNEDSFTQIDALQHDFDSLLNVFSIDWNYDLLAERFTRRRTVIDQGSIDVHGQAETKELQWEGLHGSRHTDAILKKRSDGLRDRYSGPPLRFSGSLLHSYNRLEIGDVVRVQLANVRDYTGASGPIDRSFEIQRLAVDQVSGEVRVSLFGSSQRASVLPSDTGEALPDSWYVSEGTNLTSVCTIVSGVIQAGTYDLTGHANLKNASAIYYYAGDLELADGATLTINDNVQLRIQGFFTINGDIDGAGRGQAGASDDSVYANTNPGVVGYIGSTRGWEGLDRFEVFLGLPRFRRWPAVQTDGNNTSFPFLDLSVVNNVLVGLPTDIRGTSGGIGGRIIIASSSSILADGGDGGDGGAGLAIICRGASIGVSAEVDLSGGASSQGEQVEIASRDLRGGSGAPGGPGGLLCVVDGSAPSLPDLLGGLVAGYGSIPSAGSPPESVSGFSLHWGNLAEPWAGYNTSIGGDSAESVLRVQRLTPQQSPEEDIFVPSPKVFGVATNATASAHTLTSLLPPAECVTEYFASITNNRSDAVLVGSTPAGRLDHIPPPDTSVYYWSRNRNINTLRVSLFTPDTTTTTFIGAPLSAAGGGGSGPPGADGVSVHVANVYRRASSAPATPTGGSYNFGTLTLTPPAGWSVAPPAGTDPLYVSTAQFAVIGQTGVDGVVSWTSPDLLVTDGLSIHVTNIYRRSAAAPSTPTGGSYNFTTATLTPPTDWSISPPAVNGLPLYVSTATWSVSGQGGTDNSTTWSSPDKLLEDIAAALVADPKIQRGSSYWELGGGCTYQAAAGLGGTDAIRVSLTSVVRSFLAAARRGPDEYDVISPGKFSMLVRWRISLNDASSPSWTQGAAGYVRIEDEDGSNGAEYFKHGTVLLNHASPTGVWYDDSAIVSIDDTGDAPRYIQVGLRFNDNLLSPDFDIDYVDAIIIGKEFEGEESSGLVPTPASGDTSKLLSGDGTWQKVKGYSAVNIQNGDYTFQLSDIGKIVHKASGGSGETYTIPANASVAFDVGDWIEISNSGGGTLSVAITTDSLVHSVTGSTGTYTVPGNGFVKIRKVNTNTWKIAPN